MNFDNRTAVVTGAARGIGLAIAAALIEEGARVAMVDINAHALEKAADDLRRSGGEAEPFVCDLADDASVADLGTQVLTRFGAPDLVFNNAYLPVVGGVADINLDDWRKAFEVNVLGYVRIVKAFAPAMIARGSGHFINTASPMGIMPEAPAAGFMLPYCSTKGADIGFSGALAAALQPHGLGVSVFYPDVTNSWGGTPPGNAPPEFLSALENLIKSGATPRSSALALLAGLRKGEYLISAEPGFEARLVRGAQAGFDPRHPTRA